VAHDGTLFLDEVSELPAETQAKLLRVLQEHEFEPVGSSKSIRVNVRIIAATNRDLAEAVKAGTFRSDLFYRLNVFPIRVPALKVRVSDVPAMVNFFVGRFAKRMGKPTLLVSSNTMRKLTGYDWPGNLRELQNVIERAVILSAGDTLTLDTDFGDGEGLMGDAVAGVTSGPAVLLKDAERAHIESVLQQTNWLIEGPRGAAKMLGVHPNTLRSRIQKFALKRPA
jgi:transcriptional regulator with GAF, ATPase, and Fis domain